VYRKKREVLNVIIIVCSVVFTILSAFICYREGTLFSGIHDPFMEGGISWNNETNNGFEIMLSIFVCEIFLLAIGKRTPAWRTDSIISLVRFARVFITSTFTIFHLIGGAVFENIGGLGIGVVEVTAIGYIVFFLSWFILFLDIKLKKVRRLEIQQGFN